MTTYTDNYDDFADTNFPGSTFTRTITGVTQASAHMQVYFNVFGDFDNSPNENVHVSVEGYDLGTFLDGNPGNDLWANLNGNNDVGDQYSTEWRGVADIPASAWNTITQDGQIDITYTIGSDVQNFPQEGTEHLDISFSDDTPSFSAVGDNYSTTEDTVLAVADPTQGVLANDAQPNGTGALLVAGTQHGTVTLNLDGTFNYAPVHNFSGEDSFTYVTSDGTTASYAQTVTLHVGAVNDVPFLAPTYRVSLHDTNSQIVDHNDVTGDDRGGIAVSNSHVLVTGDDATGIFDRDDLSGGTALQDSSNNPVRYDGLFNDLATRQVYVFGTDATTPYHPSGNPADITHLLLINGETGALTGQSVALSSPIQVGDGYDDVFAGAGHVMIFTSLNTGDGTSGPLFDIDLATGAVTNRGSVVLDDVYNSENFASFGIVEQFDGDTYLTYRDNNSSNIIRHSLTDGSETVAASFSELSDLASFTVAGDLNRWYFHYEGSGQFGGDQETLGYADADFDSQSAWDPATFLENTVNGAAQLIDPSISLVDPDSTFAGGSVSVGYAVGGGAEDNLGVRNVGNGPEEIGVSESLVSFGGIAVGTLSGGTHGANLVISFNANSSRAAVEAVLENLTYQNTSDTPHATRTLSLVLNDGDGGVSAPLTAVVSVTAEDDAPSARKDSFTVAENIALAGNVLADNGAGADDPDGPAPTVSKVNGQAAGVGTTVTLASGATVLLNADGSFSYDQHHAFDDLPAVGSGASNTSATDTFTYTLAGGTTATVSIKVTGIDSDDFALGTAKVDTIKAGAGDDTVKGLEGDDRLFGGAGADVLIGGHGADRTHAGPGDERDVFVFRSTHASGAHKSDTWDRLYDFDTHAKHEKVSDKIDLSALDADKGKDGDQSFRFVSEFSKATGKEPDGEVMVQEAGKNVKVLADVNGDKDADMIILVMHVDQLHKADFIL